MWSPWNDWRILPNIFQTVFQQRLLVQGTKKIRTTFILAISSSNFQYLTAGWTIKQGVVHKLKIKLWWVRATGNICLSHQCKGRAVTLFIFSNFICKHVIFHWIRGGQLNGCFGKLHSSWSLALMEEAEPTSHPGLCLPHRSQTQVLIHTRGEKNWALIVDGANQSDKMTTHSGFLAQNSHCIFFSDYNPNPPISLLPTPMCVFFSISGVWSGSKAKMLRGNKNQG